MQSCRGRQEERGKEIVFAEEASEMLLYAKEGRREADDKNPRVFLFLEFQVDKLVYRCCNCVYEVFLIKKMG